MAEEQQRPPAGEPAAESGEQPAAQSTERSAAGGAEQYEDAPPERFDVGNLHAPIIREKLEPKDGYEPVPIWLVAIFGAWLFWGGWYLATYSGGWHADFLDGQPRADFLVAPTEPARDLDPMVLGRRIYVARCLSCHQADGRGVPGQYPPLVETDWVVGEPARLKRIVLHGMDGPVQVLGNTYDGAMPAFGRVLNDQQLAAVLTYIRNDWGNQAPAISEASVAATRAATEGRVRPWRAEELLQIDEDDFVPGAAGEAAEADVPGVQPDVPHAQ